MFAIEIYLLGQKYFDLWCQENGPFISSVAENLLHIFQVGENVLGGRKRKGLMYLDWASVHTHQCFAFFTLQISSTKHISCAMLISILVLLIRNIVYIFNLSFCSQDICAD